MEWAKLAVDLLKTLAWPFVAFMGIQAVRPELRGIFARIRRLKAAGGELEFDVPELRPMLPAGEQAQEQKALPPGEGTDAPTPTARPSLPEPAPPAEPALVEFAPTGAIVNAWARLEDVVRQEASRFGAKTERSQPVAYYLGSLESVDIIDGDTTRDILQLSRLRNRVVHDRVVPDADDAAKYVAVVGTISCESKREPTRPACPVF